MPTPDPANPRLKAALAHQAPPITSPRPAPPRKARAPRPEGEEATKASISLYAADVAIIEAIREAMREHRHEIKVSQAIRLALRAARLAPTKLVAILEEMKAEDGRRRKENE